MDRQKYLQRKDLIYAGRTLFGAMPPKGQELEDHYFGAIRERIGAYMNEVNKELWKLGVTAKTQHNEVAPAQHELAPIYDEVNVAVDHNQMVMETLKKLQDAMVLPAFFMKSLLQESMVLESTITGL